MSFTSSVTVKKPPHHTWYMSAVGWEIIEDVTLKLMSESFKGEVIISGEAVSQFLSPHMST